MIFIDTSFWVALTRRSDRFHPTAIELLRGRRERLATTNHVLGESWTFIRRREGHAGAVAMVDRILGTPRMQVMRVTDSDESDAWTWLRARGEREYSFVDATSFVVMRRLAIREALAFDDDFAAAGFVELRA